MDTLSSLAVEYVASKVAVTDYSGDPIAFTGPVQMAFIALGQEEPASGDWRNAILLDTLPNAARVYGVLVGPGALVLADGSYAVWTRVTDTPEVPARRTGTLTIT